MSGPASPKQVRQMIATAIATALAASSWRESRHPYDLLSPTSLPDGRQIEHLGYAVGVLSSAFSSDSRQRPQTSTLCTTRVGVRWSHRLRAASPPTGGDYDAALDAQVELVKAVRAMAETQGQQGRITSVSTAASSEAVFGELQAEIVHHYALV